MNLAIGLRAEASRDTEEARDYYDDKQSGLGQTFLKRVDEGLARIKFMPKLYGKTWGEVRATRVRKFPYVIYYRILDDRIEVLAVMHGSRDSSAWQSRV